MLPHVLIFFRLGQFYLFSAAVGKDSSKKKTRDEHGCYYNASNVIFIAIIGKNSIIDSFNALIGSTDASFPALIEFDILLPFFISRFNSRYIIFFLYASILVSHWSREIKEITTETKGTLEDRYGRLTLQQYHRAR